MSKIELLNIDCMEYMKCCKDNQFDLAIVDPPYGIGENGSKNKSRGRIAKAKDYKPFEGLDLMPPCKGYFEELFRVSKNQIIWGANHFISNFGKSSPCWIVWDKENGSSDFADCELAWSSFKSAVRIFRYRWNGMLQGDMKNKEHRIHPTQKPVKLYQWLLGKYAEVDFKILDTHLGSGSSAIAAHYFGCSFVGCELSEHYFNLAKERFARETSQKSLF